MDRDPVVRGTRLNAPLISRRAALRAGGLTAAGLAGAALVGCGGGSPAAAPTSPPASTGAAVATPEVRRGGTYRQGMTGAFAGVDPHSSVYGGATIVPLVHTYLFRKEVLRQDLGLQYDLATSHRLAEDQVTWTFNLREDARVAPNAAGVPERSLDAEDVVESFKRMADPDSGSNAYAFFANWVERFDAPDPQTVRLVTKRPYAWVEEALGDALRGAIVPREWLAEGGDALKTSAVGAGPFMLGTLAEGSEAVVARNPNFYDPQLPRLDRYHIIAYQDQATYRTAFAADQLDVYYAQNREEAEELERTVDDVLRMEVQSTGFNSFWMRTDTPPWDDERVRRAVNRVMDRQQYVD
ncbi:MAG: ABC transporter substrate-binding protein, partial [Dehalococcoidia bacterium]